ncbi:MAG: helix-turn-helix transcriptional regulator [Deltaproteobacteria bacterium]|nr:helix-turn-helix transcriptional regulator [Deltaproteobacteria bacterium]
MAGERTSPIDPILLAASELFERQGYDGTSVVEIARRAGFARSTVFARYSSKRALLVGIVRAFHEALQRASGRPAGGRTAGAETARPAATSRSDDALPGISGLERVVRRVHEACQRLGAVARVGSAAQELPWIRSSVADDVARTNGLLHARFGDGGRDGPGHDLWWDVLRRSCIGSTQRGPVDVARTARRIALLRSGEPEPRRRAGRGSLRASG